MGLEPIFKGHRMHHFVWMIQLWIHDIYSECQTWMLRQTSDHVFSAAFCEPEKRRTSDPIIGGVDRMQPWRLSLFFKDIAISGFFLHFISENTHWIPRCTEVMLAVRVTAMADSSTWMSTTLQTVPFNAFPGCRRGTTSAPLSSASSSLSTSCSG